ncbi:MULTISPECIES: MBL fold metallo-hydrolase [unclassified Herbaspirillum]|uniref:ComEC/Rec2 family competence protein n=1 Tax=unclassified Herbaspirillum TaxID=2624150 RepID=UPI000C0AC69F|nr:MULTISPECIES: MBL fold metallo-hydrolase [unclassified Herbaspirillum]MAF04754.1 hypothetical protein [Herbaspirillum sp.]MBO15049.1 hypothetical protein [Herbaspirillum sp.]|tara:strand:- start:8744 stop:9844 length:1101 start_codon:yes stop_codon:yes gene_type:complete
MVNAYEIDFLPVGEGERSGDAIAIQWFEGDRQKVLIYDGGTAAYGKDLVAHVKSHYKTDYVDYVVNSHPDNDHAGGLLHVLENLRVGEVWMHKPWDHSEKIRGFFHDGRITDESLKERLQEKMSAAYAVQKAADDRKIPVYEPFAGAKIGIFTVLSPGEHRYVNDLIPAFAKSPELKKTESVTEALDALFDKAADKVQAAISYLAAALWNEEYLPENVETSAENDSSVIIFSQTAKDGILLTGDAGVESLKAAAAFASTNGISLGKNVTFVQVPHHGSRRNVSTDSLNLLLGEAVQQSDTPTKVAFVSAAKLAPKHPRRVVTNAFNRRGFQVFQTKGQAICQRHNTSPRANWRPATHVPFYYEVEE